MQINLWEMVNRHSYGKGAIMKTNTVKDIKSAECNIEPCECIHCGESSVIFHQYIGDGKCEDCGEWQEE